MSRVKKRIAIVTGRVGRASETFISRHIRELNGGNTVVVCSELEKGVQFDVPLFQVATDVRSPVPFIHSMIRFQRLLVRGHTLVPDKRIKQQIARFFYEHDVAVILAEFGRYGCMMQPVAEMAQIPLYTYFRGYDASRSLRYWHNRYAYRRLISKTDGIIAVSGHLLENLSRHGIQHRNSHVIPSGVHTETFLPQEKDCNLILSVGRLVEKKAPGLTLRAFALVAERHPNARLELIGDGTLLESSKKLSETLGIADRVTFLGAQPHEIVRMKLARASIFLLHSVTTSDGNTEGLPTAIQEAMASGAVVVSTRHGGITDAVEHGVTGLLVNEKDLNGYATAIRRLLDDDSLRGSMAEKGRERARKYFDSDMLLQKLESVLFENVSD